MRLIHLTDPHLSNLDCVRISDLRGKRLSGYVSWRKNRRNKYLPAVLGRLCDAVKAEQADQILLTGDLVQVGLESEIKQAAQWLNQLGPAEQVMLVPGNHDFYARGSVENAHQAWGNYLFPATEGMRHGFPVVRKYNGVSLIGLSTACVTPVFMATGKLGGEQLEKLTLLLQQAVKEKQLACLLIHHPPLPGMTNWRRALVDADELRTVLQEYPVPLVFHGHLHLNREQQWGESRIFCTAAASSISDASYRVIDIEDRGDIRAIRMTLKSMAMDEGDDAGFVTVDEQSWQIQK